MSQSNVQKILVVDDAESILPLVRKHLEAEQVELFFARSGRDAIDMARKLQPDLVLLDVGLPDMDGFEVCRRLKADTVTMNCVVVFMTVQSAVEMKIRGLDLGATDYVTKPFEPAELRARVRAALRMQYLVKLLAQKAMIDGLTGLRNREYFDERLAQELSLSARHGQPCACVLIDIDHFKRVNDTHGHRVGDEVLKRVAQVLIDMCRTEDVICRYGGEEFVIVAPNTTAAGAAQLAERIRTRLEQLEIKLRTTTVKVTASFGVTAASADGAEVTVEMADHALYEAKTAGRNRVIMAPQPVTSAVA